MSSSALSITKLDHQFGDLKVLNNINLSLKEGDYSILLGLNGAGKTTLFSLITRLYDNQTGAIEIFSHDIKKKPSKALANIGVVFQQPTVDIDLTVEQNLQYHAALHGMKKNLALENALSELKRQNMEGVLKKKVRELSGGQKRRVEIVRALMHKPKLLLLDEPTAGLDPVKTNMIFNIISTLCKEFSITMLTVSSDVKSALKHFKEFIVIDDAKIHWQGSRKEFLKKPTLLIKELL